MLDGSAFTVATQIAAGIVIATGCLQYLSYIVQLAIAYRTLRKQPPLKRAGQLWDRYADVAPPIALLVPAYNEEASIVASVRALLAAKYPHIEVVVVNDGSRDGTMDALREAFDLQPVVRAFEEVAPHKPILGTYASPVASRLLVVDKENGGKADALNCAINLSRAPLVCSIDADSILDDDALIRAVGPFIADPMRTVAVGGTVRVANGCRIESGRIVSVGLSRRLLPLLQTIEYLRAFLMARLAWSRVGALTIISGAFGLFQRRAVIAVGGYSLGTVGEDYELIVKLHRHFRKIRREYVISYVPEPVCWTEVPEDLGTLGRQRARWQRGAIETMARHWRFLLNPRNGNISLFGYIVGLLIDIIGPLAEVIGYILIPLAWIAGVLSFEYALAFLALTFFAGIFISIGSLILDELELRRFPRKSDLLLLLFIAVIENFGYRQLSNYWRMVGIWQFVRGRKDWGVMRRRGY